MAVCIFSPSPSAVPFYLESKGTTFPFVGEITPLP